MKNRIYLDNAATTRVYPEVVSEMIPYFTEIFGNSNSMHTTGREASKGVEEARKKVADLIGAKPAEIYFTSGGTESNNWALRGVAEARANVGKHIIISAVEHHSSFDTAKYLKLKGFDVDFVGVDQEGRVDEAELLKVLREDTILVSIIMVNNETGTIQNIKRISEILRGKKAYLHTDAVQALSTQKIDVADLGVDLLSCSSHKIHGPKGVGALFVREGVSLFKFMIGGEQERGRRGGTSNVPAIVGFGKACEILLAKRESHAQKIAEVSEYFVSEIVRRIPRIYINGAREHRAPTIVNVTFDFIEGESILLMLDFEGIDVSTGSACASGSLQKSHVLKAMKISPALINGAVRFSFDERISKADVDVVLDKLETIVKRLREMSPLTK